jgi:beta-lactamase superfamily II metal-dependent hydrolase
MESYRALKLAVVLPSLMAATQASAALIPGPQDLYVRIVDNGAGLCTIVEIPGKHYLVYDTGHPSQGHVCVHAAEEIVDGDTVDLMVVSHSDQDHLADGDDILTKFKVREIISTGDRRDTSAQWKKLNDAIGKEATLDATVINLQTTTLLPGTKLALGPATLSLVFGLGTWTATSLDESERKNAISIVARLEYKGRAILFTGDTIGRRRTDDATACKDAEKIMVDNDSLAGTARIALGADVMIAPHHGGNNGSSRCFIDAVSPSFVVFSSGHDFGHPRAEAAQRYLDHGVAVTHMFRTDRGDDEGAQEWSHLRVAGCQDGKGDDDVEIVIRENGSVEVEYRLPSTAC